MKEQDIRNNLYQETRSESVGFVFCKLTLRAPHIFCPAVTAVVVWGLFTGEAFETLGKRGGCTDMSTALLYKVTFMVMLYHVITFMSTNDYIIA